MTSNPTDRSFLSPQSVIKPMYFPPPPKYAVSENESKKSLKINFSKPRPSTETTTSISTTNSNTLQKPSQIILKRRNTTSIKRQRQWILLSLLVLSFTILILSVIFAYCAALPHSDNSTAAHTTATPAAVDISSSTPTSNPPSGSDTSPYRLFDRDDSLPEDVQTKQAVDAALAEDHQKTIQFTQPGAMTTLVFYTAALPLLTMLHTAAELLTSLVRPQTSQSTKLGDVLRFRQNRTNQKRRRFLNGTFFSFLTSTLLCIGWIIVQMFWTDCEVLPFSGSSLATSDEPVCPIQIRGHSMGGVSELSVVKVVLGWIVVGLYAGYCGFLLTRVGGVFGGPSMVDVNEDLEGGRRMSSMRRRIVSFRRPRTTRIEEEYEPERDDVESVVIRFDVDSKERR